MKSFLLLATAGILSVVFAGCAPKIVETEPLQPVQQNSQGQTANNGLQSTDQSQVLGDQKDLSLSNSTQTNLSSTAPANPAAQSPAPAANTTTTEEPVKTLADFQPISATEATITTSKGAIVIQLLPDAAPLAVTNFLTLAKNHFYDGIKFHRVIAGFMAQAGDPLTKDDSQQANWGTGGPGYTIQDEFSTTLKFDGPGVVAMANTGQPNSSGSQFFITTGAADWLDGQYTIFGKVTQGQDIVNGLAIGDQIVSISYQ